LAFNERYTVGRLKVGRTPKLTWHWHWAFPSGCIFCGEEAEACLRQCSAEEGSKDEVIESCFGSKTDGNVDFSSLVTRLSHRKFF